MSRIDVRPVPPVPLTILAEAGRLSGSNRRYEKFLPDLDGLYRDAAAYQALLAADDGQPVYWVETQPDRERVRRIDHRNQRAGARDGRDRVRHDPRASARHRGPVRAVRRPDRSGRDDLGHRGRSSPRWWRSTPGQAVYVPGHWVHRSVNVGTERFATLFCYAADAGQDYSIIERAGGMKSLVVVDGDGWCRPAQSGSPRLPAGRAFMIISHDLGTTGDKATLVSNDGEVLAAVTVSLRHRLRSAGQGRAGPGGLVDGACAPPRRTCSDRASVRAEDIEVVSFSGQMMGAVLLDGAGAPVRPAIIWADTRSVAQTAALVERVGMERGRTHHRAPAQPDLLAVQDHVGARPRAGGLRPGRTVVLAKDFVAYRLTGVLATDPSDASSTNAYDQAAAEWSTELIEAAELPRSLFPDIVPSTAVVGQVTAEAARATGLRGRDAGGDGRRRRPDGGARGGHHRRPSPAPTPTSARRPGSRWPPMHPCTTRRCAP